MGETSAQAKNRQKTNFQDSQRNAMVWMWGEGFSSSEIQDTVFLDQKKGMPSAEIRKFIRSLILNDRFLTPPYKHWRVTGVPSKALGMMLKDGKTIVCPSCNSRLTHIPCRGCACREEVERERRKRRAIGDGLGAAMAWMAGK